MNVSIRPAIDSDQKYFKIKQGTAWDGKTLYELYSEAYTPWEWQGKLKKIAEDLGMIFFSSPFDKSAVDFLAKMCRLIKSRPLKLPIMGS